MPIANEMTIRELKKAERELYENLFAKQLEAKGWHFIREYKFHPTRKWRFDFTVSRGFVDQEMMFACAESLPDHFRRKCIAVELEGAAGWGRHTRRQGFIDDCLKYNSAAAMGWRVFRFPTQEVEDQSAIQFLKDEVWK